MNTSIDLFYAVIMTCLAFVGGALVMSKLYDIKATSTGASTGPGVVVNVPSDFKPMTGLPPTQVEGARAILWWTVFDRAWDDAPTCQSAVDAADAAVDKVFGEES